MISPSLALAVIKYYPGGGKVIQKNMNNELIDQIIEKAIEIFSIKGYAATKMTDITSSLSISRGPVYYYFEDKLGLYEAAYNRYEKGVRLIHQEVFSTDKHLMVQMEDLIFRTVKHISKFGDSFYFMVDKIPELSEINIRTLEIYQEFYNDKLKRVQDAQKNGLLKISMEPKAIVDYFHIVYYGIIESMNNKILEGYTDDEIKKMISIQFNGLNNIILTE